MENNTKTDFSSGQPSNQQVAQAITWLVKFESGTISDNERQTFQAWYNADPMHAMAWERLGQANQQLSGLKALTARQAGASLNVAEKALHDKRRTLKTLAGVGGLSLVLWGSRDYTGAAQAGRYLYGNALADYSTTVGEQQTHALQDGSELILNTQSAFKMDFDACQN